MVLSGVRPMSVLVLDGNQRAALAITRALGRTGKSVVVGEAEYPSLAASSRYCLRPFIYPSPLQEPSKFKETLLEELRRQPYRMVLPVTEVTTSLLSQLRDCLPEALKLPIADTSSLELARDKAAIYRLAQSLDIPIPRTYFIRDLEGLASLAPHLPYPVVIKPRQTWQQSQGGNWTKAKVAYAFNPQDLLSKYRQLDRMDSSPLLQELIIGPGKGIFLLMDRGEPRASFAHLRLREKPPWGGESVLRQSVPLDPTLEGWATSLLQALRWHGVAMVEFKLDQRDQIPKLMEINGRFWGSLQLAIDAGINFPELLYRLAVEEDLAGTWRDYRIGIRSRWLLGDLESLLLGLIHARSYPWLPGRLRLFLDFLTTQGVHYEILSRDDPRPWLFELLQVIKKLLRGKGKKLLCRS